jgi:hypothetical protein
LRIASANIQPDAAWCGNLENWLAQPAPLADDEVRARLQGLLPEYSPRAAEAKPV